MTRTISGYGLVGIIGLRQVVRFRARFRLFYSIVYLLFNYDDSGYKLVLQLYLSPRGTENIQVKWM